MKRIKISRMLKKIVIGVIAVATLNLVSSCGIASENTPKLVVEKLSEKYGETFVAINIGDRFNTGSAKLTCYPENDTTIHFTVTYDFSTKEITDNYIHQKWASYVDEEIAALMLDQGLRTTSDTLFYGMKNVSNSVNTINDFMSNASPEELYLYMIVDALDIKTEESAKKCIDTLQAISSNYDIPIMVRLYSVKDDDYENCSKSLATATDITDEWFKFFQTEGRIVIKVSNNSANKTAEDVLNAFKG